MAYVTLGGRIDRRLAVAAGLLSSLLLVLVGLGPEEASAGPGVIACGATVTKDVTLQADLVDCPNNGLVVGADDVTIDLNGHTIDGDQALNKGCGKTEICDDGIVNEGFDGLTVRGKGILRQFALGALVLDAKEAHFRELSVRRNMFLGMVVAGTRNASLRKLRISANGLHTDQAGLGIFDARSTLVTRNTISANGDIGIFTEGTTGTRVVRNRLARNPEAGIAGDGEKALIARNLAVRNGDGIGWGGDDNVVRRNRVFRSKGCEEGCGMGIQIGAGHHNVVVGNRIRHADRMGLDISAYGPLSGVVAARNRINDAGKDGILVRSVFKHAKQVRLRANRVAGSGDDGIDVAIKSATLTGNGAFRNGDHGIEAIEGVKDGGGNRARGNGNPEQCKSVVCT